MKPKSSNHIARKYIVKGRVQGVGFRCFVERVAKTLGVRGWVRNHDDGSVVAYATGTPDQLAEFAGYLWKGPYTSEVRHVDEIEAAIERWIDFQIRH